MSAPPAKRAGNLLTRLLFAPEAVCPHAHEPCFFAPDIFFFEVLVRHSHVQNVPILEATVQVRSESNQNCANSPPRVGGPNAVRHHRAGASRTLPPSGAHHATAPEPRQVPGGLLLARHREWRRGTAAPRRPSPCRRGRHRSRSISSFYCSPGFLPPLASQSPPLCSSRAT